MSISYEFVIGTLHYWNTLLNFQLQTCIALFLKQQILLKEESTSQLEVTICILLDF